MLRPRHRVKSKLIWKMLAVAALVNVLIWPVLVRLGILARIRQERLIAVSLVSLPPPIKPPDALGPVPPVSVAPHPPRVVRAPEAKPRPIVMRPLSVTHPTFAEPRVPHVAPAPDALTAERALLASLPKHPVLMVAPRPARPPLLAPVPQSSAAAQTTEETDERRAARLLLAARRARAAQLEEQGHQVALQIADTRVHTAQASLPPPFPPGATVSDHAHDWTDAPQAPEVQTPTQPSAVKPLPRLRPAVALSKSSPEIPVSLQNSAWHAAFRGEFVIHPDGSMTVKMLSSTGFPVLDKRALEAARRWKFRPATVNGSPVTSTQQFEMAFNVRPMP